jgi:hypothetical protein
VQSSDIESNLVHILYSCHPEESALADDEGSIIREIRIFSLEIFGDEVYIFRTIDPSPASPKRQQGGRGAQDNKNI